MRIEDLFSPSFNLAPPYTRSRDWVRAEACVEVEQDAWVGRGIEGGCRRATGRGTTAARDS
jgi:hypothetical protein